MNDKKLTQLVNEEIDKRLEAEQRKIIKEAGQECEHMYMPKTNLNGRTSKTVEVCFNCDQTRMKPRKVNVMCLYWVGNFRGRDFTTRDVDRLYKSVKLHIDRKFDFYVLTNDMEAKYNVPAKPIELIHAWPGWWSKVELHRPDLPKGRTLYMDLDSHVIRSLQPILDYPGDLVMFETGIAPHKWTKLKRTGWVPRYQAATMLFDPGCKPMTDVWNTFTACPDIWMNRYRSEQDIMGEWIPDQPMFPRKWMIKLDTIRDYDRPPDNTIIVTGQTRDGLFRKTKDIKWFEPMARG